MKLQRFDGGLNLKNLPQFIGLNQGTVYKNIDVDLGALGPVKKDLKTPIAVEKYQIWYHTKQEWVSADSRRDSVEYEGVLYYSDRVSQPKKYDGTTTSNLGLPIPGKLTNFQLFKAASTPKDFSVDAKEEEEGLPKDDYFYVATNESNGIFSNLTYFKVSSKDKVTILGTDLGYLPDPATVRKDDLDTFTKVTLSSFTGGANVYRKWKDKWLLLSYIGGAEFYVDASPYISPDNELTEEDFERPSGVYQYVVTYYNIDKGIESGPSPVSDEQDVSDGGHIKLLDLPVSTDTQVTHKRIYRVGGNSTQFTLVVELENSATEFLDTLPDNKLKNDLLPSVSASPAPVGLSFISAAYAMLFGAVKNTLRFTPIGKPDSWPEVYSISFVEDITGIAPVSSGLLVFTRFKTYIVVGTGPDTLAKYLLSSDQGCLSYYSVQLVGTEAVWVSSDGVCRSSGNRPSVVTKPIMGKVSLSAVDSVVYDENYYVLDTSGTVLVVGEGSLRHLSTEVSTFVVANDVLYGYKDGYMYEIGGSTDNAFFEFKSARITEGSFTSQKQYKKLFIYSEGYIIIKILIDNKLVAEKVLSCEDNHVIQIPATNQTGNYIEFEISGTGLVHEIEYVANTNGK